MELHRVQQLMDKYFEATATVAEEQELKAYFAQGDIAPELQQYAPLFQYFKETKEESYGASIALPKRKRRFQWAIAASVLLAMGLFLGQIYKKQQEKQEALYAYEQTKKAFDLLAQNFNKGTEQMAYLKEFEVAKEKIYNNN